MGELLYLERHSCQLLFTFRASWKPLSEATPSLSCSLGGQRVTSQGCAQWAGGLVRSAVCSAGHSAGWLVTMGPLFIQTKWQNLEQYDAVFIKNKTKPTTG